MAIWLLSMWPITDGHMVVVATDAVTRAIGIHTGNEKSTILCNEYHTRLNLFPVYDSCNALPLFNRAMSNTSRAALGSSQL